MFHLGVHGHGIYVVSFAWQNFAKVSWYLAQDSLQLTW